MRNTLIDLMTDLVILDSDGIAHTDKHIRAAGLALSQSPTAQAILIDCDECVDHETIIID